MFRIIACLLISIYENKHIVDAENSITLHYYRELQLLLNNLPSPPLIIKNPLNVAPFLFLG